MTCLLDARMENATRLCEIEVTFRGQRCRQVFRDESDLSDLQLAQPRANVVMARGWSGMLEKRFSSRLSRDWHVSG